MPAWLWGKKENSKWEVLDSNSASGGDVWMAWALLEAGRLWKEQRYTDIGSALLKRIAREEVVTVPGLGSMLLPGKVGFAEDNSWRFNRNQSTFIAGNRPERFFARLGAL